MRDRDEEDVPAAWHFRNGGVSTIACWDDLAFWEGGITLGADGYEKMFPGEASEALAKLAEDVDSRNAGI